MTLSDWIRELLAVRELWILVGCTLGIFYLVVMYPVFFLLRVIVPEDRKLTVRERVWIAVLANLCLILFGVYNAGVEQTILVVAAFAVGVAGLGIVIEGIGEVPEREPPKLPDWITRPNRTDGDVES